MTDIQLVKIRNALQPRREPYWRVVDVGCHLDFRKTEKGAETWIGRYRRDGVNKTKSFGHVSGNTYSQALEKAHKWFNDCGLGIEKAITVQEDCFRYVENRRIEKGESSAKNAEKRVKAKIAETSFGNIKLDRLKAADIQRWRDNLVTAYSGPL